MSGRTLATIGAGILVGAAVFFTGGSALAVLQGFAIGATAAALILGPEQQQGELRPDELNITNSTEAATVPVIFGTTRLAGNHIGFDRDTFRTEAIEQEGGKGGGGSQVAGYKYYLTFNVGLCMGEVAELVKVQGSPGEENLLWKEQEISKPAEATTITVSNDRCTADSGTPFDRVAVGMEVVLVSTSATQETAGANDGRYTVSAVDSGGTWFEVSEGFLADDADDTDLTFVVVEDPVDLSSGSQTVTLEGDREDGGSCTLHPGSTTQTGPTISGVQYNHRHVCFAEFTDFCMGQQAAPRTYLFTLRRMPQVLDAGGSPIAGFYTRASKTATDPEYDDANPAAIIWELFTNDVWGKGLSADAFNVQDFIDASDYFASSRLGISTAIGGQSNMVELVDRIRDIFGLVIWDDGSEIRCRALWDRGTAYGSTRARITDQDIVGSPEFSRQAITAGHNEIKLEFTNRANNHQREAVSAMDLGTAVQLGNVRTKKVDGKEIGTRRAAEILAHRLLRVLSCPPALCQLKLRRTFAGLEPGEFVEMVWDGWRPDGTFTSFWRVDTVEDDETSSNEVTVTLVEDIYATARDGEISSFEDPIISVEIDDPLEDGSFGEVDYVVGRDFDSIEPVLAFEPNAWVTGLQRYLVAGIQRRNGSIQSFTVGWADAAVLDYSTLGILANFAIAGTLDADLAADQLVIDQDHQAVDITLQSESDGPALLAAASAVQLDSDQLEQLTSKPQALLIIGREIIQLGHVELSGGQYTIKRAIRGVLGSTPAAHSAGATWHFVALFNLPSQGLPASGLPIDQATKIRIQPYGAGASGDPTIIDGPDANGFGGQSIEPLPAELAAAERSSLTWTVRVRPRLHAGGWNSAATLEANLQLRELTIDPLRIEVESNSGPLIRIADFFASGSLTDGAMEITQAEWIPTDGTDGDATGLIELTIVFASSNPTSVKIRQVIEGRVSSDLIVPVP